MIIAIRKKTSTIKKKYFVFIVSPLSFDKRLGKVDEELLPEAGHQFEIRVEKEVRHVYRDIQRLLSAYKDEKRGPTYIAVQSTLGVWVITGSGNEL